MVGFRDVKAWQKAHQLTLTIYRTTRAFPKEEMYGLTSQLRRSSASVCANIAEGCGRSGKRDFARFLQVALGSASELEYHLVLAAELKLIDSATHAQMDAAVVEVKRMLTGFIRKLTSDV
jgi:four helix bundle protein